MTILIHYDEINKALEQEFGKGYIKLIRVVGKEWPYTLMIYDDALSYDETVTLFKKALEVIHTVQPLQFQFDKMTKV